MVTSVGVEPQYDNQKQNRYRAQSYEQSSMLAAVYYAHQSIFLSVLVNCLHQESEKKPSRPPSPSQSMRFNNLPHFFSQLRMVTPKKLLRSRTWMLLVKLFIPFGQCIIQEYPEFRRILRNSSHHLV